MSNFYDDLVRIRKEKRLSKQDVFYKCRIPLETIEAMEDGSIFIGKMRNKTYLRSYFRTYGKTVGISEEDITLALDEHDAGLYNQGLLKKYLPQWKDENDKKPDTDAPEKNKQQASDDTPADKDDDPMKTSRAASKTTEKKQKKEVPVKSKTITPETQEKTIKDIEWEDEHLKKIRSTSTTDFSSSESPGKEFLSRVRHSEPPDLKSVDWASKIKQAVYRPQRNRLLWVLIATLLALALALASIVWYWQRNGSEPAAPPTVERRAPAEPAPEQSVVTQPEPEPAGSGAADPVLSQQDPSVDEDAETVEQSVAPEERRTLTREEIISELTSASTPGDTLYLFAYALHGNLEPIRVQSDIFSDENIDNIVPRPYWVEQSQAMRFEFLDEIVFQGNLARMVLVFNGNVIEDYNDYYIDGSRIRLSRELLLENENLGTADTDLFSEMEPPRSIVDRPRFIP